eukprot:CAMPEP_0114508684 /NCGR_PEP_ID=MMETSP0109-20121206/12757_1 /TAXON_ID=29199 /ORGANISM="Chlorarachnion reptans, Strain CCCM449" /LENGTH=576 /DNA_ID=CAMNT_0001687685 /DNA_START=139 /DNA_END=1869 /DNA_ORIENTATION=+
MRATKTILMGAMRRTAAAAACIARVPLNGHRRLLVASASAAAAVGMAVAVAERGVCVTEGREVKIANWSNTHNITGTLYQPSSMKELEALVRHCHEKEIKLRPVGAGISPNGIAFSEAGMVNLSNLNQLISVDEATGRVRVQAGMRVSELVDALRPYGLTLPNYASVKEQEVGGLIQAGAHGTGATIPPLDNAVTAMRIVTPGRGSVEVTRETTPHLLDALTVGLGAFGVVAEVTLQCVRAHNLEEHTFTASRAEVARNHGRWLRDNKHIRYMWIPYTDTVVVVTNNPTSKPKGVVGEAVSETEEARRLRPLRSLLVDRISKATTEAQERLGLDIELVDSLNFAECRDWLLKFDALDTDHVRRVNRAEARFWENSEGWAVGDSSEMLQFECGGEQLVLEVAFPTGTLDNLKSPVPREDRSIPASSQDVAFVVDLLDEIESRKFPAPAPIEQRWTRASPSRMSPAASASMDDVFSWVGVIMYLPVKDPEVRKGITDKFDEYSKLVREVGGRMSSDVYPHWGKIEISKSPAGRRADQEWLARRYPVKLFNALRRELDPKNICSNELIDQAFPIKPSDF